METFTDTIRVIMFRDGDMWVAQCLEYDIGVQAEDIDTLSDRLKVVLKTEFRVSADGKPFDGIEPAPERFQQMWERRARSLEFMPAPWMTGGPHLNRAIVG